MKFKKMTALLLSVTMIAAFLVGCGPTAKSPLVSGAPTASASPADASASPAPMNIAGAYAAHDPKAVMLTINGTSITWDVLFYYIYYSIYTLQSQIGQIIDWSAVYSDETTYEDYVLDSAVNLALQSAAIRYGAEQLKVTLTDDDNAAIQADWDARVTEAGSEEAFISQLQAQYLSKELYMELSSFSQLAQACMLSMYGENGAKLTDEEVADYTEQDGYLMAKHILLLTEKKDESGSSAPLSDTEKAEVLKKAEDILSQLKSYTGTDFEAYFDELMKANSEDPGLSTFPDGYLFQSTDMVSAFSDETKALEIGGFSQELVETEFGYHIIYRLPLNYDVTPMYYATSGAASLRYITAQKMFSAVAETWVNSMNVVYSDPYKSLDFNKMFAAG